MHSQAVNIGRLGPLIGLLVLAACSPNVRVATPTLAKPSSFSTQFLPLDTVTAAHLGELTTFVSQRHNSLIAQVAYAVGRDYVFAVYPADGYLVGWDVGTNKIAIEHHLSIASPKGLEFSASGEFLMGATLITGKSNQYIGGIGLWNTSQGNLIKCLSSPCDGSLSSSGQYGDSGAALSASGDMAIVFSGASLSIRKKERAEGIYINDPDSKDEWHIGQVAIDEVHDRYAIILEEGGIWISVKDNLRPYRILFPGQSGIRKAVLDAQFDDGGNWLAFIRDDRLSIWQVGEKPEKLWLEMPASDAMIFNFDRTGTLLLTAFGDKLSIWNLTHRDKIAEYKTPELTSLSISEDNRLVIWGDSQGAVHLLGKKGP